MHVALGYRWFPTAAGYHLERALGSLGHRVTYVGLPCGSRPGYDSATSIAQVIDALSPPPDLYLWIDPAGPYFPVGIEDLTIPTACYLIDVHLGTWRLRAARFFDAVFVAQKDYLDAFRRAVGHSQVHWLPLAAAPDVHRRIDLPTIYDVGFVGNIARAHRGTPRARRLKLLHSRFRTNDFYRGYAPGEVAEIYSQSRIVFNTGIAGDVTMRVFEGSACGAMVLTDSPANGLPDLFEVGEEIVTYEDDADLVSKTAYYLANEGERSRIALAGYTRTHAEHTYPRRAEALVRTIDGPSFERLAPLRRAAEVERRAARREIYTHLHMLDAILDQERAAGGNPLRRAWAAWPCLLRRLAG